MTPLKKILIPTDFSEFSLGVVNILGILDLPKDARILFLHVLPETILVEPVLDMYQNDENIAYSRAGEAEQYLKQLAEERMGSYHRVECVVRRGDPAARERVDRPGQVASGVEADDGDQTARRSGRRRPDAGLEELHAAGDGDRRTGGRGIAAAGPSAVRRHA